LTKENHEIKKKVQDFDETNEEVVLLRHQIEEKSKDLNKIEAKLHH